MASGSLAEPSGEDGLLDCVIIGAGPAGLTALTYLTRFHRRAIALSDPKSKPRALLIERSHNLPGCPDGMSGGEMVQRLHDQAREMGGEVRQARGEKVDGKNGDFRVSLEGGETLRSRKVLLAMGVRDRQPDIPGIEKHVGFFLRYCPVCDGFEHTDKRLGIIGSGASVAKHALFLRTFSKEITVFLHGEREESLGPYAPRLAAKGIRILQPRIRGVLENGADPESSYPGCGVSLEDGTECPLSVLYGGLGCEVNLGPVAHLGLKKDEDGYIITDSCQESSIRGIYAVGDIDSDVNQISIAFGQAAVAAVRMHNVLDEEEGDC